MCNQTTFYWLSTYWFRPSYPFRPLIHSALIGSDVAKQPLTAAAVSVFTSGVNKKLFLKVIFFVNKNI
ncbi:hypothetical protein Hanom_Chr12g01118251 [Helianthus anomalus]